MKRLELLLVGGGALLVGLASGYLLWGQPRSVDHVTLELREDAAYLVQRVVDGDTIVLSNGMHVRYAGIDTPERGRFEPAPEPWSAASTDRNRELVAGKQVRLRFGRERLDLYGRILAHIFVLGADGEPDISVEQVLVTEGLARASYYPGNADYYPRLKTAEQGARKAKLGIWSRRQPPHPAQAPGLSAGEDAPLVASRRGKVVHLRDCSHARRIKRRDLIGYRDLEDARPSGLPFCKVCRPDVNFVSKSARP